MEWSKKYSIFLTSLFLLISLLIPTTNVLAEDPFDILEKHLEDVKITDISEGTVQGYLLEPEDKKYDGIVIAVTGSDGGFDYDNGILLAEEGYNVFLLSYFNRPNLPETIKRIPVDVIIEGAVEYLEDKDIDTRPLTLIGTSRGSEFAQIAADNFGEIDNIVLWSPFSYGIPYSDYSSNQPPWLYKNKIIPFFNTARVSRSIEKEYYDKEREEPFEYRRIYEDMFKNAKDVEIPQLSLDKFKGKVLIITGDDDRVAPTEIMARKIYDAYPEKSELHIFKNAGHIFMPEETFDGIYNGGTLDGNEEAYYESRQVLLDFLEDYHK